MEKRERFLLTLLQQRMGAARLTDYFDIDYVIHELGHQFVLYIPFPIAPNPLMSIVSLEVDPPSCLMQV